MFQPHYVVSPALLERIKQITVLVHELNKRAIPEIVLAQLRLEAQAVSTYASTSIEGNPLPLTEVKRLLKSRPSQIRHSEREVLNYNQALTWLSSQQGKPFSKEVLLQIHAKIIEGLLPAHQVGRLRQEPVVIHEPRTRDIVYLPPDYQEVEPLVDELIEFVQANQGTLDPLLLAGLFHKQLVIIHPFMDGNGRTTRLATNHLLAGLGLNLINLFSFENYYNQNVTRYFRNVGVFGNYYDLLETLDFTPWLEYFAEGIFDELQRVEKGFTRHQTPETTLKPYHHLILEHINAHGYITDREYAQLTDRAKATRTFDFNRLIKMGLIMRMGRGRATYYRRSGDI
jgi:Fic family protein